jgi:hypothetical protein
VSSNHEKDSQLEPSGVTGAMTLVMMICSMMKVRWKMRREVGSFCKSYRGRNGSESGKRRRLRLSKE